MRELSYGLTIADIVEAQNRISPYIRRTPTIFSPALSSETGANCYLKLDNLQVTGSFKARGAANNILSLPREQRERGVVCASTGNHSQAVAYIAQRLGVKATVVVPKGTSQTKIDGVRLFGSEALVYGEKYEQTQNHAIELAQQSGQAFVHAYLDPKTIAGQGTAALEALLDFPKIDAILVPAGGGGLMIGMGVVAKSLNENIEVIGVQSYSSSPWYSSYRAHKLVNDVEYSDSLADAIYGTIDEPNVSESYKTIDDILLVEEADIALGMKLMIERHRQIIEGASATTIAALLENKERFAGRNVLCMLSGGNVGLETIKKILN